MLVTSFQRYAGTAAGVKHAVTALHYGKLATTFMQTCTVLA